MCRKIQYTENNNIFWQENKIKIIRFIYKMGDNMKQKSKKSMFKK